MTSPHDGSGDQSGFSSNTGEDTDDQYGIPLEEYFGILRIKFPEIAYDDRTAIHALNLMRRDQVASLIRRRVVENHFATLSTSNGVSIIAHQRRLQDFGETIRSDIKRRENGTIYCSDIFTLLVPVANINSIFDTARREFSLPRLDNLFTSESKADNRILQDLSQKYKEDITSKRWDYFPIDSRLIEAQPQNINVLEQTPLR